MPSDKSHLRQHCSRCSQLQNPFALDLPCGANLDPEAYKAPHLGPGGQRGDKVGQPQLKRNKTSTTPQSTTPTPQPVTPMDSDPPRRSSRRRGPRELGEISVGQKVKIPAAREKQTSNFVYGDWVTYAPTEKYERVTLEGEVLDQTSNSEWKVLFDNGIEKAFQSNVLQKHVVETAPEQKMSVDTASKSSSSALGPASKSSSSPLEEQIFQRLKAEFTATEAKKTYNSLNESTPSWTRKDQDNEKQFDQILWHVQTKKEMRQSKTGNWQGSIRKKIQSSQLCYSPTNLDINEGPAIGLAYVIKALDGEGARENSLLFMMMELRRVEKKAPNIDSIHFFDVAVNQVDRLITIRTHALCKSYKSMMPSSNALFFDAYSKILQCLFKDKERRTALLDPREWTFQAKLEIVDTRIYTYYNKKIITSKGQNLFDRKECTKLAFDFKDAADRDFHDVYQKYYEIGYENKATLVQIWKHAIDPLKNILFKNKKTNLVRRLFDELTYIKGDKFPAKMIDFERITYKGSLKRYLEAYCGAVYAVEGGLEASITKQPKEDYLVECLKEITQETDPQMNDLGNLFLHSVRLQNLIERLHEWEAAPAGDENKLLEDVKQKYGADHRKDMNFNKKEFDATWKQFLSHWFSYIVGGKLMLGYVFDEKDNRKEWWLNADSLNEDKALTNEEYNDLISEAEKEKYTRDPTHTLFYNHIVIMDVHRARLKGKKTEVVDEQKAALSKHIQDDILDEQTEFFMVTTKTRVNEILEILDSRKDPLKLDKRIEGATAKNDNNKSNIKSILAYFNGDSKRGDMFNVDLTKLKKNLESTMNSLQVKDLYMKTQILQVLQHATKRSFYFGPAAGSLEDQLKKIKYQKPSELKKFFVIMKIIDSQWDSTERAELEQTYEVLQKMEIRELEQKLQELEITELQKIK